MRSWKHRRYKICGSTNGGLLPRSVIILTSLVGFRPRIYDLMVAFEGPAQDSVVKVRVRRFDGVPGGGTAAVVLPLDPGSPGTRSNIQTVTSPTSEPDYVSDLLTFSGSARGMVRWSANPRSFLRGFNEADADIEGMGIEISSGPEGIYTATVMFEE